MPKILGEWNVRTGSPQLIPVPKLDGRLQQRYWQMVKEHSQTGQRVAAGLNALPGMASRFASTQAAGRFYRPTATTLPTLMEPLLVQARAAISQSCQDYGLVRHDWSHWHYNHLGKKDCLKISQKERGDQWQSALLVSDHAGEPLVPLAQNIVTAEGIHSTRAESSLPAQSSLDALTQRMAYLQGLSLSRPLVHSIDREADSVGHYQGNRI